MPAPPGPGCTRCYPEHWLGLLRVESHISLKSPAPLVTKASSAQSIKIIDVLYFQRRACILDGSGLLSPTGDAPHPQQR